VTAGASAEVIAALSPWGLQQASVCFVAGRENQVFRVRSADRDFALRLKRPGYRSDEELLSELQWLGAMARAGLHVPRPEPSLGGRLLEVVNGQRVDLLSWLPGRPLGASREPLVLDDPEAVFHRLGQETARLHGASDEWARPATFTRCAWDIGGLLGEAPVWGRFWDNPTLDAPTRRLLQVFREAAAQTLQQHAGALDYGLIHADLVRENVMIDGGRIAMLDFDDAGFGFRLFDLATTLLKNLAEPDYPALKAALLAGYTEVRPLNLELLDLFIALRAATYVGWIVPRMQEPGSEARNRRFIESARTLCQDFLAAPPINAVPIGR
jgi:Ser/Thr protein kinase RdoA (MazF antagonist)